MYTIPEALLVPEDRIRLHELRREGQETQPRLELNCRITGNPLIWKDPRKAAKPAVACRFSKVRNFT